MSSKQRDALRLDGRSKALDEPEYHDPRQGSNHEQSVEDDLRPSTGRRRSSYELYYVPDDPAERTDLADEHPEVVRRLTALLSAATNRPGSQPGVASAIDSAVLEQLEILGYVE